MGLLCADHDPWDVPGLHPAGIVLCSCLPRPSSQGVLAAEGEQRRPDLPVH